jgi:hypothetical protein
VENLILELDFTKVQQPAIGFGIAVLPAGVHKGTIFEFKTFGEGAEKRLYCYMDTVVDGAKLRHRDSNSLDEKAMAFLAGLLVSAGVDPGQLIGKKVKFPFHKLAARDCYFSYTPPALDNVGNPVKGSYPKYQYLTKGMYEQALKEQREAKSAGTGEVTSDETTFEDPTATTDTSAADKTAADAKAKAESEAKAKAQAKAQAEKAAKEKAEAEAAEKAKEKPAGDDFGFLDGD